MYICGGTRGTKALQLFFSFKKKCFFGGGGGATDFKRGAKKNIVLTVGEKECIYVKG